MFLKVRPVSAYTDPYYIPEYDLPLEIGCFSRDSDCKFRDDDHQMKFIAMPERLDGLHMDLNEGYSDFIEESDDRDSGLEILMRWILSHEEQVTRHFLLNSSNPKLDFIFSSRGSLAAICSTIYDQREEWMLYAAKFRSVIYFVRVKLEQEMPRMTRNAMSRPVQEARQEMPCRDMDLEDKGRHMITWGLKFEQYMTSDSVDSKPNTSIPVNQNEKFYSVLKGKLDNHRMLFGAEIDGVDPEHFKENGHDPNSPLRYVELKTSRMMTTFSQNFSFLRLKLRSWYFQSFFCGTPKVICGFRDDDGIVRELKTYNVNDMPRMAEGLWSRNPCLKFCSEFLNFAKSCVVKDDPKVKYEFFYEPSSRTIICKEFLPGRKRLLPDWYTESV